MKVILGADHGGVRLKEALREWLITRGVDVDDVGPAREEKQDDYPDYARLAAERLIHGKGEQGILVCTTGHGMVMAANKFPGVRAALCLSVDMAEQARRHNKANVLCLGAKYTPFEDAVRIVEAWLAAPWEGIKRHERRVEKLERYAAEVWDGEGVRQSDPRVYAAMQAERERRQTTVNLIASENVASRAVREAQGGVMTDKYAEGYPGRRWYDGCETVDAVEDLAVERARALFGAEHVNVQPHCGSLANQAAYFALIQPGDTVLGMRLDHGGHLTHGYNRNFSGRLFRFVPYGVRRSDERLDYEDVARLAREHRPRLIVAGASAYPRVLDFKQFRAIADEVGAHLMVDMAHIAGLVAGHAHPSPVPWADVVTSTTHKTLRGPRGGFVLCRRAWAQRLDREIFPGLQGGPLMHVIAAKAVCFSEAMQPAFSAYARQMVQNAQRLAEGLAAQGFRLVSGGTDNHLLLLDVAPKGLTGREAAASLNRAGIIVNKNVIPFDPRGPLAASGIRLGTAAVTTRGMQQQEMDRLAVWIARVLARASDAREIEAVRREVYDFALGFPLP